MTQRTLATLSVGGSVLSAGCLGADVCGALSAAAPVLRRARPAACAIPAARGAALVQLARRLRWQRALLAPAGPRSECGAALQEAAHALAVAGVAVRRAPLSPDEFSRQPDG